MTDIPMTPRGYDSKMFAILEITLSIYLEGECGIIRIYHEYEGEIEKSVPRITDWHHEACRVMTNGDCEGRIFLSHPHRPLFLAHH